MGFPGAAGRAATVLMLLLLAACSTLPPGALDRTAQSRTIEGRLSVHYRDLETSKDESLSGRFVWTASGDDVELSLLDPLGQTVALIRSGPQNASITFRDGRKVEGATPEDLTRRTLGWTVPLQGLRYWLDGQADPSTAVSTLDDGRLRQDRWTIRLVPADGAPAGAAPRRIDLAYPGPPVEIDLRLVVDQRSGG